MNVIFKIFLRLFLVYLYGKLTAVVLGDCPPLYESYDNKACFHYRTTSGINRIRADNECEKYYHGTLATVDNEHVEKWLVQKFMHFTKNLTATVAWIGLKRHTDDRTRQVSHLWDDGSLANYTHWATNQPSQDPSKECVYLSAAYNLTSNATKIGWYDYVCQSHLKAFFCQLPYLSEYKNASSCLTSAEREQLANCWKHKSILTVVIACLVCLILILLGILIKC